MTKLRKNFFRYLAIYGCYSTGLIYVAIGTIAILSFLRIKDGGADESSMFVFLGNFFAGQILLGIILLGTVSYVVWRIYESIHDPYEYGNDKKGIALRTGIALSTIADLLIVYSSIQALVGWGDVQENGQPVELRHQIAEIFTKPWGHTVIMIVGVIITITALLQFFCGASKGYKERLDVEHFSSAKRNIIHSLAVYGYIARGIILGIIGIFFIKAVFQDDANAVVNTDKAFDFIGDGVGHLFFILVAIGTISYGSFMFALGWNYDSDGR